MCVNKHQLCLRYGQCQVLHASLPTGPPYNHVALGIWVRKTVRETHGCHEDVTNSEPPNQTGLGWGQEWGPLSHFVFMSLSITAMGQCLSHHSEMSGNAFNFASLKLAAQDISCLTEKAEVALSISCRRYLRISAMARRQKCTSMLSSSSFLCAQPPRIRVAGAVTGSAGRDCCLWQTLCWCLSADQR